MPWAYITPWNCVHGPVDSDFKKWTFWKHLRNYIDCLDYQLCLEHIYTCTFLSTHLCWVGSIALYNHYNNLLQTLISWSKQKNAFPFRGSLIYWHLRHWYNSKRFTLRLMVYRIQSIVADVSSPLCAYATDEHFASSWPATFSSFSCIYENASKHYTDT